MRDRTFYIFKPLTFGALLLVTIFLVPVFLGLKLNGISEMLFNNADLFRSTFFTSISFSIIISIISILLGLVIALLLRPISISSNRARWINLLFLPFFLGNVSVAFIFKMILFSSDAMMFAFESQTKLFILLGLIQLWQFASLFAYLFWLSFQGIKSSLIDYATHVGFSRWEFLRDVIVPHIKSLSILLFLLAFMFNFYEDAKLNLIFKASQGTGSELISQWLYRNFRSDLLINFDFASSKVFSISLFLIIPIVLSLILIFALVSNKFFKYFCKSRYNLIKSNFSNKVKFTQNIILILIVISIIVPAFWLFYIMSDISLNKAPVSLLQPLILTALAALIAAFFAIFFAISARIAWSDKMSGFNSFSILFIGLLFLLLIVPPITLMISGFYWIRFLDISNMISIVAFWILGHSFLSLPILGSFTLVNHFRVSSNELSFHKVHKARRFDVIRLSFLGRFKLEYFLVFIFAFSLIWNEAVLNRVFSDSIPSFVSVIIETISSRNADYSAGLAFFSVSLLLGTACILLWILILNRAKKHIL